MAEKIRIQDRVLLELYLKGRELSTEELMEITKLRQDQIYRACWHLKRRGLIGKNYEEKPAGMKNLKSKFLIIKITNVSYARKVLNKKGLV